MKTVHLIAAARPKFVKVAPLYHALTSADWAAPGLVHTGQHDVYGTPPPNANEHLQREGGDPAKIDFVGNIMNDSYEMLREQREADVQSLILSFSWIEFKIIFCFNQLPFIKSVHSG
mgnify:CR=1 FL=1